MHCSPSLGALASVELPSKEQVVSAAAVASTAAPAAGGPLAFACSGQSHQRVRAASWGWSLRCCLPLPSSKLETSYLKEDSNYYHLDSYYRIDSDDFSSMLFASDINSHVINYCASDCLVDSVPAFSELY